MRHLLIFLPFAALGLSLPALASGRHHHGHHGLMTARSSYAPRAGAGIAHASQGPLGGGETNPYANYNGPGSAVLNATERARGEPGVTLELAPDAKETATGGPVGGPPGFDGS